MAHCIQAPGPTTTFGAHAALGLPLASRGFEHVDTAWFTIFNYRLLNILFNHIFDLQYLTVIFLKEKL